MEWEYIEQNFFSKSQIHAPSKNVKPPAETLMGEIKSVLVESHDFYMDFCRNL